MSLMNFTAQPLFDAYSFMYTPLMMPMGNATMALPVMSSSVPTIAGKMPPEVMPSVGASLRNSQLITPAPL